MYKDRLTVRWTTSLQSTCVLMQRPQHHLRTYSKKQSSILPDQTALFSVLASAPRLVSSPRSEFFYIFLSIFFLCSQLDCKTTLPFVNFYCTLLSFWFLRFFLFLIFHYFLSDANHFFTGYWLHLLLLCLVEFYSDFFLYCYKIQYLLIQWHSVNPQSTKTLYTHKERR